MDHLISNACRIGIDLVSDVVLIGNADGTVVFMNSVAQDLFGDERPILGEALESLFETSIETSRAYVQRAASGSMQQVAAVVRRPDGEQRATLVRIGPVLSQNNGNCTTTGLVAAFEDVTDEFRARQAVAKAERAHKLEAIGQLVSGVAHELNNPLAAVVAYAQIVLSNKALTEDDRRSVDTILQESKRAAKIVSNLLTFARQHEPERSITDVNQVVVDTVSLHRYALTGSDIDLKIELDQRLPLIWADSFQIQQVLLNLMSNAEQALQTWNGERRLTIATKFGGERILLTVADSGPGISDELVNQIFNPFFTTKAVGEGTGLGLSISDGIIRGHGGRIRVESAPGTGAAFIVELPYSDPSSTFLDDSPWPIS